MELIVPLVLIFIAVLVMFIRLVARRSNASNYQDNLVSEDDLNLETRNRLLKYLSLFGMTITSGIAFIGVLVLFFSFTTETRMTGNFMDDVLPSILSIVAVFVGVIGTIAIVRLYKKI